MSEHGEVLPLGGYGDYENGSVLVPLANGFPYGTTQSFQIYVSAHIRDLALSIDSLFRNSTITHILNVYKWLRTFKYSSYQIVGRLYM